MKRILITGMSGTGKSTLIRELSERGFHAIDADCDEFSTWVEVLDDTDTAGTTVEANRDWVWREDRIQETLSSETTDCLFLSGCAANMGKFFPQFDNIVLLSAPSDLIVERLLNRKSNSYGKQPDEATHVLDLIETVEPLLRRRANCEIDTSASIDDVMTTLLHLVEPSS